MITYQLSTDGLWAEKIVDSVKTGEWANTQTKQEYLEWIAQGNIPLPPDGE